MSMQKTMLVWGALLGGFSVVLRYAQWGWGLLYDNSPQNRFLFVVLPLLLLIAAIFGGILQTQKRLAKRLAFSQMLKIGLGISLIAALEIGVYHLFFISHLAPDFLEKSFALQLEQIQQIQPEMTQEQLQETRLQMQKSSGLGAQFALAVVPYVLIGFFVSLGAASLIRLAQKAFEVQK